MIYDMGGQEVKRWTNELLRLVVQLCAALVELYADDEAAAGLLGAVDAVACKLRIVGRCLGCNVPTNFLF